MKDKRMKEEKRKKISNNAHDPIRSKCAIFVDDFLEWIHSKCSFEGKNMRTIKINKISVISFQCLLNFGSISIMPFHQCMRFDEYVWRYIDDISMFRCTLRCGSRIGKNC